VRHFKSRKAVGALVLLAVAAIVWWSSPFQNTTKKDLAYRYVPGERIVYQIEYVSAAVSSLERLVAESNQSLADSESAASEKGACTVFTQVSSELEITVIEATRESTLLAFRLRNPDIHVIVNETLALSQGEAIQADLEHFLFADLDRQGRIRSLRLAPAARQVSRTFISSLLASIDVALPGQPPADAGEWETLQDDPNGHYTARYQVLPGDGQTADDKRLRHFTKTRAAYLPVEKREGEVVETRLSLHPAGLVEGDFDEREGILLSLNGTEALTFFLEGRIVGRSESKLNLTFKSKMALSSTALEELQGNYRLLASSIPAALSSPAAPGVDEEIAMQTAELGDATLASLLEELAKAETAGAQGSDDTPLYLKLKALIYLHPEACEALADKLRRAAPSGPTFTLLTGALSSIGHEAAQRAIAQAIRARTQDWPALSLLIPALGTVKFPTLEAEATLQALASGGADWNTRSTAQLSLGIMARALEPIAPQRGLQIVRANLRELESTKSEESQKQLLLVLGNAGYVESLPTIACFLQSKSGSVRTAAIGALRWIASTQVDGMLTSALDSDADPIVRLECATVFGFRKMTATSFAAHERALRREQEVSVRLALLQNVARCQTGFVEAQNLLRRVADNDQSAEVQEEATKLLNYL
jgi:hypothetical protein